MRFNFWSWLGLAANLITIAATLAFLVLMVGLGRRQRGNRSFAAVLSLLLGFIGAGQSTQVLLWLGQGNPTLILEISGAFFFFQAIALFHFAGRLLGLKARGFYVCVGAGLTIGLLGLIPLANHQLIANPSLSPTGLLRWDTYLFGYLLVIIAFSYLLATPMVLLARPHQRPHPTLIIGASIVSLAEIAGLTGSLFSLSFPLLALGVTAGIATLGSSMVHFQLFKPLGEMTLELQKRQAELEERNRRLEEANARLRELDEWKEKMTQMVIHDLKNPLNVVGVVLDDFTNSLAAHMDATQHRLLRSARVSARRIQRLISSSLDVHRLEEGRLPINPVSVDMSSLIDECIEAADPVLSLYQITVDVDRPGQTPYACADPDVTGRVIDNLLDNAIKFSPSNSTIAIRVSAGPEEIQVSISDSGPGVPPDQQQRIFDKFFQIAPPAGDIRPGVGLGLTFSKLVLEAQGGRIWVESEGQDGATFHFTLPAARGPAGEHQPASGNNE